MAEADIDIKGGFNTAKADLKEGNSVSTSADVVGADIAATVGQVNGIDVATDTDSKIEAAFDDAATSTNINATIEGGYVFGIELSTGVPGTPGGPPGPPGPAGVPGGFGQPTASIDNNVGTPSVEITATGPDTAKIFGFVFKNLKGNDGLPGSPSGFGVPTISVGSRQGNPSASITATGPDTAKVFDFAFDGLVGPDGRTPEMTIGDNGNWFVDGVDTGKPSRGANGNDGADGVGVPAGGATGQFLTKSSATDYETEWQDVTPEGIGAFAENPQLVTDMSFANLKTLPAGSYLVSNSATDSPNSGVYGAMIVGNAAPSGSTARMVCIVEFNDGAVFFGCGKEGEFSWQRHLSVSGGEMHGAIVFDNNTFMFGKDSGGTGRSAFEPCTSDNRTTMGYGNYAAGQGRTSIYGNAVDIQSKSANINLYCDGGSAYVKGRVLWGGTVLYANDSGNTGTVTLTESAANFQMIEIYFATNDGCHGCAKVYLPNGKNVTLMGESFFWYASSSSFTMYHKMRAVTISGTTISNYAQQVVGEANTSSNNSCGGNQNTSIIGITRVVGYAY